MSRYVALLFLLFLSSNASYRSRSLCSTSLSAGDAPRGDFKAESFLREIRSHLNFSVSAIDRVGFTCPAVMQGLGNKLQSFISCATYLISENLPMYVDERNALLALFDTPYPTRRESKQPPPYDVRPILCDIPSPQSSTSVGVAPHRPSGGHHLLRYSSQSYEWWGQDVYFGRSAEALSRPQHHHHGDGGGGQPRPALPVNFYQLVFENALVLKKHLSSKVRRFARRHFGPVTIGVQVRANERERLFSIANVENFIRATRSMLAQVVGTRCATTNNATPMDDDDDVVDEDTIDNDDDVVEHVDDDDFVRKGVVGVSDVRIFVATETKSVVQQFQNAFGRRAIITYPPVDAHVEVLPRHNADAVVTFALLAQCDEIIVTSFSSYGSNAASSSGKRPIVCTRDQCHRKMLPTPYSQARSKKQHMDTYCMTPFEKNW